MSFVERDYKETRKIMLGRKSMKPEFVPLADWIGTEFGVRPVNIFFDWVGPGVRTNPRLGLIFERDHDLTTFKIKRGSRTKRTDILNLVPPGSIIDKFEKILEGLDESTRQNYSANHLFLWFSAFEQDAIDEAGARVSQVELDQLAGRLAPDMIWCIHRKFIEPTFFLNTEEQRQAVENTPLVEEWQRAYFELVKPHDVFGYVKEDSFQIAIDSKENFDQKFHGNWFQYDMS